MFRGENLANLRLLNGLSRKQLSEILEVTEQTVWQYENNFIAPKLQTINLLKTYFNVKTKYFYSADVLKDSRTTENINLMYIAYRSKVLHAISKTRAEAKHLEYLDEFVDEITRELSYPTFKIIELRNKIVNYLNKTTDSREMQIENIAKKAREWLGLNETNNDNLLLLIEKSGVFVFEKATGAEMDAYSLWTERDRPYIMLGNLKRSAARRNFDIAHELGHLLLHFRVEFANLDRKGHTVIEKEANTFAGAFLLPQDSFLRDVKSVKRPTNPGQYIALKEKWHVSL